MRLSPERGVEKKLRIKVASGYGGSEGLISDALIEQLLDFGLTCSRIFIFTPPPIKKRKRDR